MAAGRPASCAADTSSPGEAGRARVGRLRLVIAASANHIERLPCSAPWHRAGSTGHRDASLFPAPLLSPRPPAARRPVSSRTRSRSPPRAGGLPRVAHYPTSQRETRRALSSQAPGPGAARTLRGPGDPGDPGGVDPIPVDTAYSESDSSTTASSPSPPLSPSVSPPSPRSSPSSPSSPASPSLSSSSSLSPLYIRSCCATYAPRASHGLLGVRTRLLGAPKLVDEAARTTACAKGPTHPADQRRA